MSIGSLVRWSGLVLGAAAIGGGLSSYLESRPAARSGGIVAAVGVFLLLASAGLLQRERKTGAGLGGRGGLGLLAMGVVALTVLVTSGIAIAMPSYQAGRPISGEGAATGVPGPASAGAGDGCPLLQPGAALALAANDGCGVARVASSLDCGRISKLPDGWTFDGTGTGSREPLSFIGQTCHLFVPAYLEDYLAIREPTAQGVLLVADFIPQQGALVTVGLRARCTTSSCLQAGAVSNGNTVLWGPKQSSGNRLDLRFGAPNRLALWAGPNGLAAWLNGSRLGSVDGATAASGWDEFFLSDSDRVPADLDLIDFAILATA